MSTGASRVERHSDGEQIHAALVEDKSELLVVDDGMNGVAQGSGGVGVPQFGVNGVNDVLQGGEGVGPPVGPPVGASAYRASNDPPAPPTSGDFALSRPMTRSRNTL
jgi:hypothetical protein